MFRANVSHQSNIINELFVDLGASLCDSIPDEQPV